MGNEYDTGRRTSELVRIAVRSETNTRRPRTPHTGWRSNRVTRKSRPSLNPSQGVGPRSYHRLGYAHMVLVTIAAPATAPASQPKVDSAQRGPRSRRWPERRMPREQRPAGAIQLSRRRHAYGRRRGEVEQPRTTRKWVLSFISISLDHDIVGQSCQCSWFISMQALEHKCMLSNTPSDQAALRLTEHI